MVQSENSLVKPEGNPNDNVFQAIFPVPGGSIDTVKFLIDNPIMTLGAGRVDVGSKCSITRGIDIILSKIERNPDQGILLGEQQFCEQSHKRVA